MEPEPVEKLWEVFNNAVGKIVECEAWGFDLTAAYALVTSSLSKIRKRNPIYSDRENDYKRKRAVNIGTIIKERMLEMSE